MSEQLTITEIYASIQGESSFAGFPCVFVRTTGCPLRCRWCDTVYAFHKGQQMGLDEILEQIEGFGIPLVELTGGEPLAQAGTVPLIKSLISKGYKVLIETSGSEDVSPLPPETHIIMDLKCPDSKMADRNLWSNLDALKPSDEIKFVVASREDFNWVTEQVREHRLDQRFQLLYSSAWGLVDPKDLVTWLLESKLGGRMQLQMHKYIWGPRTKGV